jgi:hypothetical protein
LLNIIRNYDINHNLDSLFELTLWSKIKDYERYRYYSKIKISNY